MSHLSQIAGKHRLRYRISFPDGSYADRSRRYKKKSIAMGRWPAAEDLEEKTLYQNYTNRDIDKWKKERLLNKEDIEKLGFSADIKTLNEAIEEYRQSWDVSSLEAMNKEIRLKAIVSILGGNSYLKTFRYSDGFRLRTELKAKGYKIVTIQKCLREFKRCLNLQVANQAIEFNPFATLSGGRVPSEEKITPVILTDEQVSRVIAKTEGSRLLRGWLKIFLLMFFGCGIRRKEALAVRWENINWDERSLLLTETKTGRWRKVGLGQKLFYELLKIQKKNGFIFPQYSTRWVTGAFQQHLKSCGIEMRLHDARHTYASLIQQKGAKPIEAMARTGHSDMSMLSHYSHDHFGEIFEDRFSFMKVTEGKESEA